MERAKAQAAIEALMRKVFPAAAVCERGRDGTALGCGYSATGFIIRLDVHDREMLFIISYPDVHAQGDDRLPIPARQVDPSIYAADITRALEAMKPILEQDRYEFDRAQIDQCLQLPLPETGMPSVGAQYPIDNPPNQFQVKNDNWTLSCGKGPAGYSRFVRRGNGFIGIEIRVQRTPPPPSNRF